MARYLDEASAAADGYTIEHDTERQQFRIMHDGRALGEANYALIGDTAIDFNGTVVTPELRGTGLAGVLAHRAMSDEVVRGRDIVATCWFMEGYLAKHPELLDHQ